MSDKRQLLDQALFFSGISELSRDSLAGICLLKKLNNKELLFYEGEKGPAMFLLLSGNIQLHKTSPEGKEIVLRVIKPGEVFGEVILFEEDRYPVTALAIADSEVLAIPKVEILKLLERVEFRVDFISMLMKKMRYLGERIQYLSNYDVEERLRLFLKEHFGAEQNITCTLSKKDVAAAIGATPESLSRLLLRLKELNLLDWQGSEIKISNNFWA